jgi:hypothetical protein
MRAIRLPNGNLLVPVEADDSGADAGVAEIGPEHPEYGKWLAVAEDEEGPRPVEVVQGFWPRCAGSA